MESKNFVACHCDTGLIQLINTKKLQKLAKAFYSSSTSAERGKIVRVCLIENGKNGRQPKQAEIRLKPDDSMLDQYLEILFALKQFERTSRNVFLPLLLPFASVDLQAKYDNIVARELFHIHFVRQVAACVALETAKVHDRTKDAFSTFVNCGKFEGIVVPADDPRFQSTYDEEFRRHAGSEPHHPEYERINGEACDVCSVREMAVDRLTRNVVAANGHVDRDVMNRYLPRFTLGDVSGKLSAYERFVAEYETPVVRKYEELLLMARSESESADDGPPASGTHSCSGYCPNVRIFYSAESEITIELTDASVPT